MVPPNYIVLCSIYCPTEVAMFLTLLASLDIKDPAYRPILPITSNCEKVEINRRGAKIKNFIKRNGFLKVF